MLRALGRHTPLLLGLVLMISVHSVSCSTAPASAPAVATPTRVSVEPPTRTPASTSTPTPLTRPTSISLAEPTSIPVGQRLVSAVMSGVPLDAERVSVVIEHPASGTRAEHAADRRFVSASLYKLGLAYEVLRQVDAGALALDDRLVILGVDTVEEDFGGLAVGSTLTVREALAAALGPSSNAAAFALLRLVGRPQLNHSLVHMPLPQTSVPLLIGSSPLAGSGPPLDREHAVTSPDDMALLLRRLATDTLLDRTSNDLLRELLALEDPWNPIGEAVPAEMPLLMKTGTLPGVWNIAGLVGTAHGWVTLVVLSEDADRDATEETVVALAQVIHTVFGAP